MKQALILGTAVLFLSFPLILQADPGKQDMTKATTMKPLPAMKSTLQSPSAAAAMSKKAAQPPLEEMETAKAKEESSDAAESMADHAKKMSAKKSMDKHK